jgi:uncharacterized protein (DUF362 family)
MNTRAFTRRAFLRRSLGVAAGAPFAAGLGSLLARDTALAPASPSAAPRRAGAQAAIVACRSYGPEVRAALDKSFDLLGGIGSLVKHKTVTVKINLTGTDWTPFLGRPVGEIYMTHYATAAALGAALFDAGASRVRFVESTASKDALETSLTKAKWDVPALAALGRVEFENTRNLGKGGRYSDFRVPTGGLMFSSFEMNHSYADTDVLVSLAKLKNHCTAGVTLSMKNLFGLPPNTLYGSETGEDAIGVRAPLHNPKGFEKRTFPGMNAGEFSAEPTWRVPRITVDICAARPIDLAIIDGIASMSGGEGPWNAGSVKLRPTNPGVIIAGFNMVSTDAVATAVMGYEDPRVTGKKPFDFCDNHLLMAEQAGLGTADLSRIEVRGLAIEKARFPYG